MGDALSARTFLLRLRSSWSDGFPTTLMEQIARAPGRPLSRDSLEGRAGRSAKRRSWGRSAGGGSERTREG